MATVQYAAFLAITLVLGSSFAAANFTIPFISSSIGDEACKTDVCGKGSCVASSSNFFGFECQCEKGWKQARSDEDQFFKFLPCVIPNYTNKQTQITIILKGSVNFNCAKAPDPSPSVKPSNQTVFDSCYWTDCGGGSCNKTSAFTHSCVCEEGYYNLFNSTSFPCYKECSIGGDCATLGIGIMNSSRLSPPRGTSVVNDESHASSLIIRVESSWLITMVTTLAPFLWKYC